MEQRTLLLVDGSTEERGRILRFIHADTRLAYRLIHAASIAGAVEMLRTVQPDCVIISETLPDGNCMDFILAVRGETGRLPFPTIILAESGDPEVAVSVMKAGALDYFVKSVTTVDEIRQAVGDAVGKRVAERRIEEQRVELERLYAEARANNEALRVANSAKDDFLAMLSHQLRTPLSPVLSIVSATLSQHALPPDLRETFSVIQRNIEIEARLIDDLLDLTQICSGRLKMEKSPVDLHDCLAASLDVCRESFEDKRITVRTELAAKNSFVLGEFARLSQAFWNILKNAVKFGAPHGNVLITSANEGPNIILWIHDDGVGIDPERLESIFGAFNPIKPQPTATGVGLGLAITRAIIEGHDGTIHAESQGAGRGAAFRLCLPVASRTQVAAKAPARGVNPALRGKTILIVEDQDDTRRVLSRALRMRGYGVTVATSVSDAAEQYIASPADFMICDIGLPDGTGWDLMEKLRPHGPVPAIAVSGYGMRHDVRKSREVGFLAHLTKPIDFPKLETLIAESLTESSR